MIYIVELAKKSSMVGNYILMKTMEYDYHPCPNLQ